MKSKWSLDFLSKIVVDGNDDFRLKKSWINFYFEGRYIKMSKRIVLGIQVTNRVEKVPDVQKILTDYGFNPAPWNPPAPAGGGMRHKSREVALL